LKRRDLQPENRADQKHAQRQFRRRKKPPERGNAALAENLQFEQAQQAEEKLALFEDYQGKSTVVNPSIRDVDVFAIADDEKEAFVNYLKVVNGAIIHTYTLTLTKNLDEDRRLCWCCHPAFAEKFNSITTEIIVPV
jgi:excinuclease ABC subunit C